MGGSHHLRTSTNYYDSPGDDSPPVPVYVGKCVLHMLQNYSTSGREEHTLLTVHSRSQVVNNRPMISVPTTVEDVTGREADFSLDVQGFQYCNHSSSMKEFHDVSTITTEYYDECAAVMKSM
jgi:hypothetical protein